MTDQETLLERLARKNHMTVREMWRQLGKRVKKDGLNTPIQSAEHSLHI